MSSQPGAEQIWKDLMGGQFDWQNDRKRFGLLPAKHRCKNCNAPFDGVGAPLARLSGHGRFRKNPRFCDY